MAGKAMAAETKKELIEKLGLLATFFALAARDAGRQAKTARAKEFINHAFLCEGRADAYNIAFMKIDGIIKEARK